MKLKEAVLSQPVEVTYEGKPYYRMQQLVFIMVDDDGKEHDMVCNLRSGIDEKSLSGILYSVAEQLLIDPKDLWGVANAPPR